MATQRPLKEGSVRTYQEKVALGFPDILASEMDADLDTIYAAWNGTLGGVLQGNLPNPTLQASSVRGTPSSGATAREIQKASIWGGDDLIDLSVPLAKLAVNAALAGTTSITTTTPGTAADTVAGIASTTLACRGGLLLVAYDTAGFVAVPSTAGQQLAITITVDGGTASFPSYVYVQSGTTSTIPYNTSGLRVFPLTGQATRTVLLRWQRTAGAGTWTHVGSSMTLVVLA